MLNNEFAYRCGIVPRETGLLVAFSLFQTPLNISGDVSLQEHPVFSALVSSFTRQEKPEVEKRRPEIRLRFAGYRDVRQEFFVCSCLCCCCCCFCFLTLSFSVCLSNGKPGKRWIFPRTTYFPFCVSIHIQGINKALIMLHTRDFSLGKNNLKLTSLRIIFTPCKGIQDCLGFWIPRRGFRILRYWIPVFVGGTWILHSNL